MSKTAAYWIEKLNLIRHPEGGYYRETYRSAEAVSDEALPARFGGPRSLATAIYFLLEGNDRSALHRIKSDELWHFHAGSSLTIHVLSQDGSYSPVRLGDAPEQGEVFQATVSAGCWFGATVNREDSFTLVSCTVAPGFDFADFELGTREELLQLYPQHQPIIERLCPARFTQHAERSTN